MRILLIGEFSSFHLYLRNGLRNLGHDVVLASNMDGWKQIEGADIKLEEVAHPESRYRSVLEKVVYSETISKGFVDYDVVQLMCPGVFHYLCSINIFKRLKKNNKLISLVAAGSDYALHKAFEEGCLTDYALSFDKQARDFYKPSNFRKKIKIRNEQKIADECDIIIPASYEYTVGYRGYDKLYHVIPMPIDLSSIQYKENRMENRVTFFHGISRPKMKGTSFILEALKELKKEEDVDIIVKERVPFNEYITIMNKTNVLIDQCCSYGYGINALIGMAEGKLVMSGAREEALKALNITSCPVWLIRPDQKQILSQMREIVKRKDDMVELGAISRRYVEQIHECTKVASQYVEAWKSTGKV